MRIDYEGRFLEEAVLQAAARRPEGRLFHRERGRLYRVADPEERAEAFDALTTAWCARFGLVRPLETAIAEQRLVDGGVARGLVGRPPHRREAGADLLVHRTPRGEPIAASRVLRILLAPEWLLEEARLVPFLRRELQHVADTIDPRFGYEPRLPPAPGPAQAELLRQRYRVAWDTTVDGRLVADGCLPASARAVRREEFLHVFGATPAADDAFACFFADPRPTHAGIVAFVAASLGARGDAPRPCALCGFPTADPEPDPALLPAAARADIGADFPAWTPADGCCRQCADLYRTRPLSRLGLAALPVGTA